MSSKRIVSLLGSVLVADGLPFLLNPRGQAVLWSGPHAPEWFRRMLGFFAKHSTLCRTIAAFELVAGAGLLIRSSRTQT